MPAPGDRVLDLSGKWIVPGYLDPHVHLFDSGSLYTSPDDYDLTRFVPHEEERRRIEGGIEATLSRFPCAGVTTVGSLAGPKWELTLPRGEGLPKVVAAGAFLAGFPVGELSLWTKEDPVLVQVGSPESARARVRELLDAGVGIVKAGHAGPGAAAFRPVLEAIVAEAHARGVRVAMHAEELEAAKMSVRSGVDVLAHTVSDRPVDEELIALARDAGVISVSGLAHFDAYAGVLEGRRDLLPIESRCGDPEVIATWDDLEGIPPSERPAMPEAIRRGSSSEGRALLLENVRRLHAGGVRIAAGTNGGNVGTLQGPSFHRELAMMAEAGIPLAEILIAATRNGAEALGILAERGTLEAGKLADAVVLAGDPLADVEAFAAIDTVVVEGSIRSFRP